MPKIEEGASSGIFKIDGIPHPTTQYDAFYNNTDLTATGANVHVTVKQTQGNNITIAQGTLDNWTNNLDAGFADLQAFVDYLEGFFFEKSAGGSGGASVISAESAGITGAMNGATPYTRSFTLMGAVVGDKVNWGLNDDFDADLESMGNEIYGTARVTAVNTVRVYWRIFTYMAENTDRKVWAQIVK
jgi:hypothetical protein